MKYFILTIYICILATGALQAQLVQSQQQDSLPAAAIPARYTEQLGARAGKLEQQLEKKTEKALEQLKKGEEKLRKKLQHKDSLIAASVFGDAANKYKELEQRLQNTSLKQYIPRLDSLSTSLKFLQQNPQLLKEAVEVKEKLKDAMAKVKGLEKQFQKADELKRFLKERKQFLHEQLDKLGLAKQLKKLNKQAYYYAQQVNEYKEILNDPKKIEKKALELLSKTKFFQDFFRKNSLLASLFRMPGDPNDPGSMTNLAGLQTRSQVNSIIQQQISAGGPNAQQQFTQNIQAAQAQLNQLKDKVLKFGGSSSEDVMPEGFKPNPAKGKTFFQRITISGDFQTARHNRFFPINSDLGLSASYMLNARSHLSVGSSIKVGWGSGFNHIRISAQGIAVRGGLDWKLKGNLFIAGKYEQNYFSEIRNIDQLRNYSSWKTAGLLGISKKFTTKKNKGGTVSLLYDFFYNRPPVRTQPVVFRISYNLK